MASEKKFTETVNTGRRSLVLGTAAAAAGLGAAANANADPFTDLGKQLGITIPKQAEDAIRHATGLPPSNEQNPLRNVQTPQSSPPVVPGSNLPPYEFKNDFDNSLGTADLTTGAERLTASGKPGFTQRAQAAYDEIISTVATLKTSGGKIVPPGIKKFNANTSGLTDQERAQVIGSVISRLRSVAPLRGDSSAANNQDPRALESRNVDGAYMVGLFISSVPDAKHVGIKWVAPANQNILREGSEVYRTDINQPGTLQEGTINEFLASAYQEANRNQSSGNANGLSYRLYDERFRPTMLKLIDNTISQGASITR